MTPSRGIVQTDFSIFEGMKKIYYRHLRGSSSTFGDSSVTIAQWWRVQHFRNLLIRKGPGSISAENMSTQIHMDLSI